MIPFLSVVGGYLVGHARAREGCVKVILNRSASFRHCYCWCGKGLLIAPGQIAVAIANILPPDLCLELPAAQVARNRPILKRGRLFLRNCGRCECSATCHG